MQNVQSSVGGAHRDSRTCKTTGLCNRVTPVTSFARTICGSPGASLSGMPDQHACIQSRSPSTFVLVSLDDVFRPPFEMSHGA